MSARDHYKRQELPPIRDVLGDQLDRRPSHYEGVYSVDAMQRALPSPTVPSSRARTWPPATGPTLAPIHSPSHPSSSSHSHYSKEFSSHSLYGKDYPSSSSRSHRDKEQVNSHSHSHHSSSRTHNNNNTTGSPAPYSFDVFRPTSAGLIHASRSDHSQGILRSTRVDAGRRHIASQHHQSHDDESDDREKRYPCPHCGKRFSRPSSLKTHEIVHTDEKPFECKYPGCGKTFTVASNMRRHYRKAHEGTGSGDDEAEEHYGNSRHTLGSSTQYYTSYRH